MRLTIYRRADRRYGWRLNADSVERDIVATDGGQGYERRIDALHMAMRILDANVLDEVLPETEDDEPESTEGDELPDDKVEMTIEAAVTAVLDSGRHRHNRDATDTMRHVAAQLELHVADRQPRPEDSAGWRYPLTREGKVVAYVDVVDGTGHTETFVVLP